MKAWTLGIHLINPSRCVFRSKISWPDYVRNEEILRPLETEREPPTLVTKQKTLYLGHIHRYPTYAFLEVIIEGKIEEKRGPERRKCSTPTLYRLLRIKRDDYFSTSVMKMVL